MVVRCARPAFCILATGLDAQPNDRAVNSRGVCAQVLNDAEPSLAEIVNPDGGMGSAAPVRRAPQQASPAHQVASAGAQFLPRRTPEPDCRSLVRLPPLCHG